MKKQAEPEPAPDWNLHITALVSPTIREAIVTLVMAAQADHEELANLQRAAALLKGRKRPKLQSP